MQNTMSASLGDSDFFQNLFQFMNQSSVTQNPSFINPTMPLSLSPHEAEKHGRDENMMDEDGDGKRRESANSGAMESGSDDAEAKPKKKPGRKMMMTEPANKRKAQNRAAQRAFRERKEAHLKGLENRVTELEQLTQTKDAENAQLKSQVQTLQQELMRHRGTNFDFDFSMKNAGQADGTANLATTIGPPFTNPFQPKTQSNGQQQSSPSPSSGSITDSSIFRSNQSSLATSPENDANKNATPNMDVPFDLFSGSAVPVTFGTNNSSNRLSPLFSTDLFSHSPMSTTNGNSLFNQAPKQTTSPILDTFASTLASLQKGQSPPDITTANPFNSSMSSTFTGNSNNLYDLNDPLFSSWRDSPISSTGGEDSGFDIFDTMFSSMSPGAFNLVDMTSVTEFITDSPVNIHQNLPQQSPQQQNLRGAGGEKMSCPELWEQVRNLPNFEEADIDQLCAEMRSKAKCTASGSTITPRDVDETLSPFVKSEDTMS